MPSIYNQWLLVTHLDWDRRADHEFCVVLAITEHKAHFGKSQEAARQIERPPWTGVVPIIPRR